jgi:elongator complex protein 3
MPGLPGSSPEKDIDSFRAMFADERFRPDMLKIYPTLVVKGTRLYDSWAKGEYRPYSTEEAAGLVAQMKSLVPRYCRIQRIQRDIPADLIEDGVDKSHLRELARDRLAAEGRRCQCIRCREVGLMGIRHFSADQVSREVVAYRASGGMEYFISDILSEEDALVGYARLRIDGRLARIRELKVFGQMAAFGQRGEAQHRGFGKALLQEAERIASSWDCEECLVTSGVGVRNYYRANGYALQGPCMAKRLPGQE